MAVYIRTIFAENGDKNIVPFDPQAGNEVSYDEGWTPDYSIATTTAPSYKAIERLNMNGLLFVNSGAIQQYQQNGTPDFITTADNNGVPFPYERFAKVRASDGNIYESKIAANTDIPPSNNWAIVSETSQFYDDISSTDNLYTLIPGDGKQVPPSTYFIGMKIGFVPHATNIGPAQIEIPPYGPVDVFQDFNSPTLLPADRINIDKYQEFIFNGTGFVITENDNFTFTVIAPGIAYYRNNATGRIVQFTRVTPSLPFSTIWRNVNPSLPIAFPNEIISVDFSLLIPSSPPDSPVAGRQMVWRDNGSLSVIPIWYGLGTAGPGPTPTILVKAVGY